MRWERRGRSRNLEDRRAQSGARRRISFPGGRGRGARIPIPMGRGGGMSLTTLLVLFAVMYFLGINPLTLLGGGGLDPGMAARVGDNAVVPGSPQSTPLEEQQVDFVSFVLDDLQSTWSEVLPGYRDARLVLFRGATRSGCGMGQSEMGPFYCPADEKVYIDLSFYDDLRSRFGAPGDFAQAYVLAHEIGHHIQSITGLEQKIRTEQSRDPRQKNELSVRMELQADCLAGVWGSHANSRGVLEVGDIEEGLRAAAAIGDDRIQSMSGRGVHPDSFTHGSSADRQRWLERGLESGNVDSCDTFGS